MTADDPHAAPALDCDIVMKGGITSGVVYPGAVLALARQYRFRCIGGASAGGIAAALVAAAEHARADAGFDRLAALPDELAGPGSGGGSFMLQLFRPDASTRPLFGILIGALRGGPRGALVAAARGFWRTPAVAAALAIVAVLGAAAGPLPAVAAVALVAVAAGLLVAGTAWDVVRSAGALPANDYGLCRLGPGADTAGGPALTGWLHERLQTTAGRGPGTAPLTFADLWAGSAAVLPGQEDPAARLKRLLALSRDPDSRAVDLQLVTTDLTHGRPLRLPVPYQPHAPVPEDGGALLFDPEELRAFFPAVVVEHLITFAPAADEQTTVALRSAGRPELRRFPVGPDLPVLVATRMTLSFPVLIAAVPLYELDEDRGLVRVLFSDGGISSNFPVHFFDSPLPRRPTFGLNLVGAERGEALDPALPGAAVRDPAAVDAVAFRSVARVDGLGSFLAAIKDAAQNWRDNAQAELPGFRDRVVHVKLAAGEGGLNLTMDAAKIAELNARGAYAGERLVALFAGDGDGDGARPRHWNDHRFLRYRTTMSLLEQTLRSVERGYTWPADPVTIPYPERVDAGAAAPYAFPPGSLRVAHATTDAYLGLVAGWKAGGVTLDDAGVPRPRAVLRAVPPV